VFGRCRAVGDELDGFVDPDVDGVSVRTAALSG
jgi:hypothetical protein